LRKITLVKNTTLAASPSGKLQNTSQEMLRSVVTQLRVNTSNAPKTTEPDIDFDELRAAIDELPELNSTKIVALHRRIVNGDYKIDSERLASKLIELESSLDSE
jgi:flagellar biosynthesis anti-sigma factor FlgM|tara:strand:- start:51 stop:362 length:312 start_codon:yes stop_codon:yes gene_type:complete